MDPEQLVVVRQFQWLEEAQIAESLLNAAGVPCELYDEFLLAGRPLWVSASGGMRLLVPASRLDEAIAVLESAVVSDEELAAQAEAAGPFLKDADLVR